MGYSDDKRLASIRPVSSSPRLQILDRCRANVHSKGEIVRPQLRGKASSRRYNRARDPWRPLHQPFVNG